MRMSKISDREIKLLLVVLILAILLGTYQLGYQKFHKKTLSLKSENMNMLIGKNELLLKQLNGKKILVDTEELKFKTDRILAKFPSSLTQEKSIMLITYLSQLSGMKIYSISFRDTSMFYSPNTVSESSVNIEVAIPDHAEAGLKQGFNLKGYKTEVTFNYQTTYSGLKKCISQISNSEERMNISNLSAAFDNATGNLTGMMTLQMYAIDANESHYDGPVFDGVSIGRDNIFSTIELQVEE
ncbi:MAG TPA: hypothetical protein VJ888_09110 [Mobilitalea sp.]|nr:hypothetical protein [Mobilitalea sp.]